MAQRPKPKDHRFENAYLFGAVCPSRDTGVAIIMSNADIKATQPHIEEISRTVAPGADALLTLDKAGSRLDNDDRQADVPPFETIARKSTREPVCVA